MLLLTAAPGVQEWHELIDNLEGHLSASVIQDYANRDAYLETYRWVRPAPDCDAERVTHWTTNPDACGGEHEELADRMAEDIGEFGYDWVGPLLGSGNFSVVFECPWDNTKCIKIGHGGLANIGDIYEDGWLEYALYCMKRHREGNANPLLPVIHKIHVGDGYFVALLEKYRMTASSFDADQMRKFKTVRSIISSYDRPKEIDEEYAAHARALIADPMFPRCHDIHNGNVMCDNEGRIIITDPSSDTNAPHMEIERTLRIMGILPEDEYAEQEYQRRMAQKRRNEKQEQNNRRMLKRDINLPRMIVDEIGVVRFDDMPEYATVAMNAMNSMTEQMRAGKIIPIRVSNRGVQEMCAFGEFHRWLAVDPAKPISIRKLVGVG